MALQGIVLTHNFTNVNADFDKLIASINQGLSKPFNLNINVNQMNQQIQQINSAINNMGNNLNQLSSVNNNKPLLNSQSIQKEAMQITGSIDEIKQKIMQLDGVKDVQINVKASGINQRTTETQEFIATIKTAEGEVQKLNYGLNSSGNGFAINKNMPINSITDNSVATATKAQEEIQKENELVQKYLDELDMKQQKIWDKTNEEYNKKMQQEQEYQVLLERNAIIQEQNMDKIATQQAQQQENQALTESLTLLNEKYDLEERIIVANNKGYTSLSEQLVKQQEITNEKLKQANGNLSANGQDAILNQEEIRLNDINNLKLKIADQDRIEIANLEQQLILYKQQAEIKINNLNNSMIGAKFDTAPIKAQIAQIQTELNSLNINNFNSNVATKINNNLRSVTSSLGTLRAEARTSGNVFTKMLSNIGKMATWTIAATAIFGSINAFKEGVKSAVELDSTLSVLKITMNSTSQELQQMTTQMQQTAIATGSDIKSVEEAVKTYANASETAQSTLAKSKSAIELSNVSGLDTKSTVDAIKCVA